MSGSIQTQPAPSGAWKDPGYHSASAPKPLGAYVETLQTGNLLFLSGTLPVEEGRLNYVGRIGAELSVEDGRRATRLAALNALALCQRTSKVTR